MSKSVGSQAKGSILHNLHYNLQEKNQSIIKYLNLYYNANYVTYRGKGSKENTEDFEVRENWVLLAWN